MVVRSGIAKSDHMREEVSLTEKWVKAVLVIEAFALAVALVSPITPSRTGSTWSPAFSTDPTYLDKVLGSFVLVNVMLVFLGLVVWVVGRWSGSGDDDG